MARHPVEFVSLQGAAFPSQQVVRGIFCRSMKIYIAAFYHSRKAQAENSGTAYARAAALADPAYSLELFHYIGDNSKLLDIIRSDKRTIFLDFSAFSMFTQGIKVDLKAYACFVEQNHDIIEVAASLDFIGAGQEQQNYDQLKTLETMLGGKTILPVHHVRDTGPVVEEIS